jgi:hypothetical protein
MISESAINQGDRPWPIGAYPEPIVEEEPPVDYEGEE